MNNIKKLFPVFITLLAFTTSGCAPQEAARVTHMGQKAREHVTLEVVGGLTGGCGAALLDFVRVLPDGNSSGGAFRVPEGKVLVVTDVDWQYVHPNGPNPGAIQILRLFIENLADSSISRRTFESTITLSTIGQGGASEHMTGGFIVSSAGRICPDVFPGPQGPPGGLQHLILRGYLAADE